MNDNFYINAKSQTDSYPVPVQREPQIMAEMTGLQKTIDELAEVIAAMNSRISPLMRDSIPMNTEKTGLNAEEQLVPLADMLRNKRYQVNQITRVIGDMLQRLEL